MAVYLIRHGQSEFNAVHSEGMPDPMIFDAPLTEKGVFQAKQLREAVSKLNIQLIMASPLTRALQTAQHIFGHRAPIVVMAEARELLTHSCDVGRAPDALRTDFPDLDFDMLDDVWWHHGQPNALGYTVEPREIFAKRIGEFSQMLVGLTPGPIAIVGHGNTFHEMTGHNFKNCEVYLKQVPENG